MQVCKFSISNINVSLGVSQQRNEEFFACQIQPHYWNEASMKQLKQMHSICFLYKIQYSLQMSIP